MKEPRRILAVIPARGGSKGLPRKNVLPLAGKPLIIHTIEAARGSLLITDWLVSTDDDEILEVSRNASAKVIERPWHLATDSASNIDVALHAAQTAGLAAEDLVVLLQPTSPLRKSSDIDNAIRIFIEKDCDSVISVSLPAHPIQWSFSIREGFLEPVFGFEALTKRRQELPLTCMPNGAIYVGELKTLEETRSFLTRRTCPMEMPPERSIDIDTRLDFIVAEKILRSGL